MDRIVSVTVLVLTGLLVAASGFLGMLVLAFLDYCPPESCSVTGAMVTMATGVGLAGLAALLGVVATVGRLKRRLPAWPFAVGTLVSCVLLLVGGGVAYNAAVGW